VKGVCGGFGQCFQSGRRDWEGLSEGFYKSFPCAHAALPELGPCPPNLPQTFAGEDAAPKEVRAALGSAGRTSAAHCSASEIVRANISPYFIGARESRLRWVFLDA